MSDSYDGRRMIVDGALIDEKAFEYGEEPAEVAAYYHAIDANDVDAECVRLMEELDDLTYKHEGLIDTATHGMASKAQTPNRVVEQLMDEHYADERWDLEQANERLRKLCEDMHDYFISGTSSRCDYCDRKCDYGKDHPAATPHCGEFEQVAEEHFTSVMRELGIEV